MKSKFQDKKALELLLTHKTIQSIADTYNVSLKTVYLAMQRLGISTPTGLHRGAYKGSKHWNWKGGKHIDGGGYVQIHIPEHPNANRIGCVLEHRLVMEKHLGRLLEKQEVIHHRNGIRTDNRLENLEILSHTNHQGVVMCPFCLKRFLIR